VPFLQSYSQLYFLPSRTHHFPHTPFTSQCSNGPCDWMTVADRYLAFTTLQTLFSHCDCNEKPL
jgi:hypothetical protein